MNEGKAARFHRLRRRNGRFALAARAAVLAGAAAGWPRGLDFLAAAVPLEALPAAVRAPLHAGCAALALGLAAELAALPFVLRAELLLERRFGLSRESVARWLGGQGQATAIRVAGWAVAAAAIQAAIGIRPDQWWLAAGAGYLAAAVAQARVAPWLAAVMFRTTPLRRPSLRARLEALARRSRAPVIDIHEWRVGPRSDVANAMVAGIGPSRRILVSDTLLDDYSDAEIEVIIAHEIGHHVHRDLWQMIVCRTAVALAAFRVAALGLDAAGQSLAGAAAGAAAPIVHLPMLALVVGAVTIACAPIVNLISRWHEHRADRYAIAVTGNRDAFVSSLRRLGAQHLAEERPSRFVRWCCQSHPPLAARMARAAAAKP